jgi:hypothetical protein
MRRVFGWEKAIDAPAVAQISGTRDRVLQHSEGRLAMFASIPIVAGVSLDLIARTGWHHMQGMAAARQRNRFHDGRAGGQIRQHRITHESTNPLYSDAPFLAYLKRWETERSSRHSKMQGRRHLRPMDARITGGAAGFAEPLRPGVGSIS